MSATAITSFTVAEIERVSAIVLPQRMSAETHPFRQLLGGFTFKTTPVQLYIGIISVSQAVAGYQGKSLYYCVGKETAEKVFTNFVKGKGKHTLVYEVLIQTPQLQVHAIGSTKQELFEQVAEALRIIKEKIGGNAQSSTSSVVFKAMTQRQLANKYHTCTCDNRNVSYLWDTSKVIHADFQNPDQQLSEPRILWLLTKCKTCGGNALHGRSFHRESFSDSQSLGVSLYQGAIKECSVTQGIEKNLGIHAQFLTQLARSAGIEV